MSKALELASYTLPDMSLYSTTDEVNENKSIQQVVTTDLAADFDRVGSSFVQGFASTPITLASVSNSLSVEVILNYELRGNGTAASPEGYFELRDGVGNILDYTMVYNHKFANDNFGRHYGTAVLKATYNPNTLSETPAVWLAGDQGMLRIKSAFTNKIIVTELVL